jgi:hypothetical protein
LSPSVRTLVKITATYGGGVLSTWRSYAAPSPDRTRVPDGADVGYGDAMSQMYDLTLPSIHGEPVALEQFRGKVLLIINVASY